MGISDSYNNYFIEQLEASRANSHLTSSTCGGLAAVPAQKPNIALKDRLKLSYSKLSLREACKIIM